MIRLALIIAVLLVIILLVIRLQGNSYKRFLKNSAVIMGKIEKKETRIDNTKNKRSENYLLYSYEINGKHYSGEEKVEYDDLWLEANAGMELRVYYDKRNPQKSYPAVLIDRRIGISEKF